MPRRCRHAARRRCPRAAPLAERQAGSSARRARARASSRRTRSRRGPGRATAAGPFRAPRTAAPGRARRSTPRPSSRASSSSARALERVCAASARIASVSTVMRPGRAQAWPGEERVVVDDDPVVDPDHRPVAHGMVVGRDRRVALRVVADVDQQLVGARRHLDAVEQLRRRRALLDHRRAGRARGAVGVPDRIGAALRDRREQGLRRERALDGRVGGKAESGYTAHCERKIGRPRGGLNDCAQGSRPPGR